MARLQFSGFLRSARVNQFDVVIGSRPILELRSGSIPATCANADTGTLLCAIQLPIGYMSIAGGGQIQKIDLWTGTGLPAAGTGTVATYFRFKSGVTCHCQGDISEPGGGGAMMLDDPSIEAGESVTVNTFTLIDGNA